MLLSIIALTYPGNQIFTHPSAMHYIFVVPSGWEEDIREVLLRPLLIETGLISKDDHKGWLLFCTDLESICYNLTDTNADSTFLNRGKKTIFCRLSTIKKNEISIKLDLVSTVNSIFDFSDPFMHLKVVRSNSVSLTIYDITEGIKVLLNMELPIDIHEELIQKIIRSFGSILDTVMYLNIIKKRVKWQFVTVGWLWRLQRKRRLWS